MANDPNTPDPVWLAIGRAELARRAASPTEAEDIAAERAEVDRQHAADTGQLRDCDAPRFARLYLLALGELKRLSALNAVAGADFLRAERVIAICRRFEP